MLLVEKDETIAALWSWLVRVSAAEVLRIPLVGAGETVDDLRGVAPEARSLMNVPFFLKNPALDEAFLKGAQARGLVQLKGQITRQVNRITREAKEATP